MSFPKMFVGLVVAIFAVIGVMALVKRDRAPTEGKEELVVAKAAEEIALPEAHRMEEFFNVGMPRFPWVETIIYSSRVPWLQGKHAWVSDYAAHFGTSRHFIARSLNGEADYDSQTVANGDRFNVFRSDVPLSFHLVVDISRSKMWVYCLDEEKGERTLVQTYPVGVGRSDVKKASGYLTPLGTYSLGGKIAVYRPGTMGQYNKQLTEMVRVFGTRWIPFDEEIADCTAPAKGLGLHGCPWKEVRRGELEEDDSGLQAYDSDGCIRLSTDDMEELFSVVISKPARVYLVKDLFDAKLPGKEVE